LQLEKKTKCKAEVEELRKKKKEHMKSNKANNKHKDGQKRQEENKHDFKLNESKKVIYALWMAKICFQVGEAFHNPINIHPISQPLLARLNYLKHFSILARVTSANPS
jgi:hypothetical protein